MVETVGMIGPHPLETEDEDFQKAVGDGRVFIVANQTADTSAAGLSGTTPVLSLANPLGNEVKGKLWFAGCVNLVAFGAAAAVWVAVGTNAAAAVATGTDAVVRRAKLGSLNAQGNTIEAFINATLPAAPVGVALLGAYTTAAITTVPSMPPLGRWFNGAIEIMPGTNLSIQTSTASGAGLFCEFIWEEVAL